MSQRPKTSAATASRRCPNWVASRRAAFRSTPVVDSSWAACSYRTSRGVWALASEKSLTLRRAVHVTGVGRLRRHTRIGDCFPDCRPASGLSREHPIGGFGTKVMFVVARCVRMVWSARREGCIPVAEAGDGEDRGVQSVEHQFSVSVSEPESAKCAAARAPRTPPVRLGFRAVFADHTFGNLATT